MKGCLGGVEINIELRELRRNRLPKSFPARSRLMREEDEMRAA